MCQAKDLQKQIDNFLEFIRKIDKEQPSNFLSLFFSYRNYKGKYISFQPVISNDVQKNIFKSILQYITQQLSENKPTNYNAMGVLDGYMEIMDAGDVIDVNSFLDSILIDNIYRDQSKLKIEKIGFYCFKLEYDKKTAYIFRHFQKLKKLRNGHFCQLIDSELRIVENILGIDQLSDIILFDGNLFLLNHIALERIFYYRDEFQKKTNEAINVIKKQNIIHNVDSFATDCLNDVRIMKRFTSLMSNERLPLFFEHYNEVPNIVSRLKLDIAFDSDKKIIYQNKSQLYHVINLLSDAYFESLLLKRTGVTLVEDEI